MNSVNLIGNLATDVELRDVGEEKKVANFLLAVDHGGSDGGADLPDNVHLRTTGQRAGSVRLAALFQNTRSPPRDRGAPFLIATEQARGPSGRDVSSPVHYALTFLPLIMAQATACAMNATEARPGVVN